MAYYSICAGTSPHPTNLIEVSPTTLARLTRLTNGVCYYFRITAVDFDGHESSHSNEENIIVNIVQQGEEMVKNNDFSSDQTYWACEV